MFALTAQFPWVTDLEVTDAGVRWDSGVTCNFPMAASPAELLSARLRNQQLIASSHRKAAQVVSWLGAMQAQDFPAAKWAIGLRAPGIQDGDVEQAFNDGLILRTHVLRPTWHFVTPEDIRWLLKLSAPRIHAQNAYYYRQSGLDAKTFSTTSMTGGYSVAITIPAGAQVGNVQFRVQGTDTGAKFQYSDFYFQLQ